MSQSLEKNQTQVAQGITLFQNGQHDQAQAIFADAVITEPDNAEYKALFVQSLAISPYQHYHSQIKQAISLCFEDQNIRHIPLFSTWHMTLLRDTSANLFTALSACSDYKTFEETLLKHDFVTILNDSFFCQGLKKLLIKNYDFERMLTYLRRYFLCHATGEELELASPFLNALAIQCFFNEYLYYVSAEEQDKLADLEEKNLLLYGCYFQLHSIAEEKKALLKDAEELIQIQVTELTEEQSLQLRMNSFGTISDRVSKEVQQQYEQHPFPRWIACGSARDKNLKTLSKGHKILIAGCGTGQQAVTAAFNFPYADMTAIDLSRTSLAYAQRKAQQYKLKHLNFMHGDILEVSALDQKFDYITCGGVLHHMESPEQGLRALKDVLNTDGIMRIALYSEIARQDIVRVQNWIQEQNIPSTDDGIREFRKNFFAGEYKELFEGTSPYFDCFSISETRDLFFHVQEHRFTCLSLKALLQDLDLDLLIFAPEASAAHQAYKHRFIEDPLALNLENWHQIERENPSLFLGMYKLYICHKGQHRPGDIPKWLKHN